MLEEAGVEVYIRLQERAEELYKEFLFNKKKHLL